MLETVLSFLGGPLLSFFGGAAFRMIWGEVSSYFTRKQEHGQEMERMRLQADLDAAQHARNLQAIKLQGELGIKTVQVQAEAAVSQIEAQAWLSAVEATGRPTGIWLADLLNAIIRPGVAVWSVVMMTLHEFRVIMMSGTTSQVAFAALGIYLADRTLGKRGK